MRQPTALVLFDIDGTLVQTAGAGVRGMNAAFAQLHGWGRALDDVPIAGRTDRVIVRDAFRRGGVEAGDGQIAALRETYVGHLLTEMRRAPEGPFGVLPGVESLIATLAGRADVVVGLLTGNFERGAAVKLRHFDLCDAFAFGAFGDAHLDRRDLVPVALASARQAGYDVPAARTVIIGDTPLDVDCAHAHGARAVAVATGLYDADVLAATGADLTVMTLEALEPYAAWLAPLVTTPGSDRPRRP
jgi:phosphoglycolate phosphatase-like HAD superfamily hydrolase